MQEAGLGATVGAMIDAFEDVFDVTFPPGHNPRLRYMSHLWEPLRVHWRPLAFYAAMEGLAALAGAFMWAAGFERHRIG